MARGDLPPDGELQLGPVRLPAGRRVVPWDEADPPTAWVTREPVPQPGPVWAALSGLHAETGLLPVLVADEESGDDLGSGVACDLAEIGRLDPAQILAARWAGWQAAEEEPAGDPIGPWPTPLTTQFLGLEPGPDGPPGLADIVKVIMNVATDPAASAELSRLSELDRQHAGWPPAADPATPDDDPEPPFPGLAPSSGTSLSTAERDGALGARPPARIALVPAARPADVLAVVGWSTFDDPSYPDDIRNAVWIGSVLRSWEDRFGARLLTAGPGAEITLLVQRPPRTRAAAAQIAAEHCAFCDECAGRGLRLVPEVAAAILDAPTWTFWWD